MSQLDVLLDLWHQIELTLIHEGNPDGMATRELLVPLMTSAARSPGPRKGSPGMDDIRIGELRWNALKHLVKCGTILECDLVKGAKPHQDCMRIRTMPIGGGASRRLRRDP